jgi:hypothetical protein
MVRDCDTRKPLAGVSVTSGPCKAVTDKEGRYELLGLPKASRYDLEVQPAEGQFYLHRSAGFDDTPGLEALTADVEMVRGLTVRGKVTDKATGKPPAGALVVYHPLYRNPYVNEKLAGIWVPRSETKTGADGSYALPVLPGQGKIGVIGPKRDTYMPAFVSPKEVKDFFKVPLAQPPALTPDVGGNAMGGPDRGGDYHALVLLEPGEKEEALVRNVALEPPHRRKGRVVGPDGRPLTGVTIHDLGPGGVLKGDEFIFCGNLKASLELVFIHADKNLAFYAKELPDEKAGPLVVKLQPCGSISGRLVDPDGQPLPGAYVLVEGFSVKGADVGATGQDIAADKQGRIRAEGLIPGMRYLVTRVNAKGTNYAKARALTGVVVEPGKNKDLGDLKVDN